MSRQMKAINSKTPSVNKHTTKNTFTRKQKCWFYADTSLATALFESIDIDSTDIYNQVDNLRTITKRSDP